MTRSPASILAERRLLVAELRAETHPIARGVIQFNIDQLDQELAEMSVQHFELVVH